MFRWLCWASGVENKYLSWWWCLIAQKLLRNHSVINVKNWMTWEGEEACSFYHMKKDKTYFSFSKSDSNRKLFFSFSKSKYSWFMRWNSFLIDQFWNSAITFSKKNWYIGNKRMVSFSQFEAFLNEFFFQNSSFLLEEISLLIV